MAAPVPAIEVDAVVKEFKGFRAVDGVSFGVPAGQVCALLGPNGAGKTTTIHMLLGLTLPTSGTIRLLGTDVVTDRTTAVSRTNFSASYVQLPYRLNTREILAIYADLYEVADPAEAIEEVIELVGISELTSTNFAGLSSGQQTMVGIAKALVNRPEILILDEPTASLDPEHAFHLRRLLLDVARERCMTVFVTSHNMSEIERMAERVLFMARGKLIADAPPAELREQFRAADLEEVFLQVARRQDEQR